MEYWSDASDTQHSTTPVLQHSPFLPKEFAHVFAR